MTSLLNSTLGYCDDVAACCCCFIIIVMYDQILMRWLYIGQPSYNFTRSLLFIDSHWQAAAGTARCVLLCGDDKVFSMPKIIQGGATMICFKRRVLKLVLDYKNYK